jgi:ParB family transcriptional regulator, chromosome partitioning protein
VERRSGLGKGLAALIPAETPSGSPASLQDLPVASIEPNPNQPRAHFDEDSLADLAASIRELGILQPVLVRAAEPGRYRLIAGERRWRAARRAGLDTIPAIVRETDELGSIEQALVENLHRQDLTALEEASAYQQLIEDFDLTHDEVATRVGKSRVAVTNTLRLLQLPPTIQHFLADGRLTAGHARALLGTPDRGFQETLARRAVDEHLSVRAVEEAVRVRAAGPARIEGPAPAPPVAAVPRQPLRPPGLLELEELLSDYLDTRVSVTMGTGRGKLVVEFATLEDLERIYRLVTEAPERH